MKYLNKIDEEFVREFAENFFKMAYTNEKPIEIKKCDDCWAIRRIVCAEIFKKYAYIYLFDYNVESSGIGYPQSISTIWRTKLYEKFGEEYLNDLKTDLKQKIDEQYKKSLEKMDSEILNVKQGKEKSDTGRE